MTNVKLNKISRTAKFFGRNTYFYIYFAGKRLTFITKPTGRYYSAGRYSFTVSSRNYLVSSLFLFIMSYAMGVAMNTDE